MADAGLFIGWGQVVRGREKRAVQVFNESVEYWGGLQGDGKIEGFELAFGSPTAATCRALPCCAGAKSRSARCAQTRNSGAGSFGPIRSSNPKVSSVP